MLPTRKRATLPRVRPTRERATLPRVRPTRERATLLLVRPTRERATLLLVLACLATALACAERESLAKRPDIILISIDSLRPDHLGSYGYPKPTSPTIDQLAASGVRFSHAVSSSSWTLPAHTGLFTGLFDLSHGVTNDNRRLSDAHVTLAEILRDSGYQTAGFYGAPYLHPTFGLGQGFEVYEGYIENLWENLAEAEFRSQLVQGRLAATEQVTGPRMLAAVQNWLTRADERPAFLFLHAWDVHFDYIPPERYVEMFDPNYEGTLEVEHTMHNPAIHAGMPRRDLEHLLARYDGEIRFTDDILAEIFGELERRGRLENAIVVLTADHGEEFFEHDGIAHRRTLFDEVVRVPMIVAWPGKLEANRVVDEQVQLIDLLPTLLSLAELPLPVPVQGRDLSPLLRGEALEELPALLQLEDSLRAIRNNTRKLVVAHDGSTRYFDLSSDPQEQRPLAQPGAEQNAAFQRLGRLVKMAREFRNAIGERGVETIELDPAMHERLKALGYIAPTNEGGGVAQ